MEKKKADMRKYVRYSEAVKLYGMGMTKLREVAVDAGALYRLNRLVLINTEKMDAYIETFLDS